MKKNAIVALTVVNTAGLLAVVGAFLMRAEPATGSALGTDAQRVAQLEQRVAQLEARTTGRPASGAAEASELPATGDATPLAPNSGEGAGADAAPAIVPDDSPVTRAELETLVAAQLERREAAQRERWKAAARPKRTLKEVASELALDPRQEAGIRQLYRQVERDSMRILFEVDEAALESLKAQLGQAEHDPRLKEQLRERIAVNWTRRQSEIGVLWVKLDARLREELGTELLERYYRFDVQLEEREFPDIKQMFFADPKAESGD